MTFKDFKFTENYLYEHVLRRTVIPLIVMIASPNWTLLLSYMLIERKGSLLGTFLPTGNINFFSNFGNAWAAVDWFDGECWAIILGLFAWAALGMLLLPGKPYYGPLTPGNFRPVYYHTAVPYYFLTMALACLVIWTCSVLHLYYKFTTFTAILILTGLIIVALLYVKGKVTNF